MYALRSGARLAVGVVLALALLLPAVAQAKGVAGFEEREAPAGITITGIGFARLGVEARASGEARERASDAASPTAVDRALGDARRRAQALASVVGIQVGPTTEVDLRELSQFGQPRSCRRQAGKNDRRCRRPTLTAAAVTVTFGIVGGTDGSTAVSAVHAGGEASVAVRPTNPKRNQPIRRAVLAARSAATPQAAAVARRNARRAAHSAGLDLGGIVSISEAPPPYYSGSFFYDAALGTFGPGQFCGFVRRPVVKVDPKTGVRRVVRRVRERRCRPGSSYSVPLRIHYEAS